MMPTSNPVSKVNETDLFRMGPTLEVYLPDGTKQSIRERNGADEDILSKLKDNRDGSAINNFLASISVSPKLTPDDIQKMRIKNKYYLLFKSRIQSLGNIMSFWHTFTDGADKTKKVFFEEDLSQFDWDFSKSLDQFPSRGTDEYFEYRCTPYPQTDPLDTQFEFEISSGKKCRMMYLTGVGESLSLKRDISNLSINERLRLRKFEIQMTSGQWQEMENFSSLTSKEMTEIRSILNKFDSQFDLVSEVVNPLTGQVELISLFLKEDFFFPLIQ